MNTEPIIIEQVYNITIEKVWNAITDEEQMRQWFFETMNSFKPEVGFETKFDVENNGIIYPHHWKVTEVIPGKRIVYDWVYDGFPGFSFVQWELFPEQNKTRLILTHTGMESFPQDNPDFSRESYVGGWNCFIGKRLPEFLDV